MEDRVRLLTFRALRTIGWAEHEISFVHHFSKKGILRAGSFILNEETDFRSETLQLLMQTELRRFFSPRTLVVVLLEPAFVVRRYAKTIETKVLRDHLESGVGLPEEVCEHCAFLMDRLRDPNDVAGLKKVLQIYKEKKMTFTHETRTRTIGVSFFVQKSKR